MIPSIYFRKRVIRVFFAVLLQIIFLVLFIAVSNVSDVEMQQHFDDFFEEVFTELEEKYGEIEEMNVCDNLGDHLVGNVYVKVLQLFFSIIFTTVFLVY